MNNSNTKKISIGDLLDISYAESQKILPQIQKEFDRKVKFIIVQDGRVCLVHDW